VVLLALLLLLDLGYFLSNNYVEAICLTQPQHPFKHTCPYTLARLLERWLPASALVSRTILEHVLSLGHVLSFLDMCASWTWAFFLGHVRLLDICFLSWTSAFFLGRARHHSLRRNSGYAGQWHVHRVMLTVSCTPCHARRVMHTVACVQCHAQFHSISSIPPLTSPPSLPRLCRRRPVRRRPRPLLPPLRVWRDPLRPHDVRWSLQSQPLRHVPPPPRQY